MRIGKKCYKSIEIKNGGETVCRMTDNQLTLAQGYSFDVEYVEWSISREELLELALFAVEQKISDCRIATGRLKINDFIESVTPLIEKRDILRKALEEAKTK